MMTFPFPFLNILASLIVAVIVCIKLVRWSRQFTPMESWGMALTGAGCLLTIGPIVSRYPTPFEDWSGTLLRLGCAIYFIGRMLRHRHLNAAAVRQAEEHFRRRS